MGKLHTGEDLEIGDIILIDLPKLKHNLTDENNADYFKHYIDTFPLGIGTVVGISTKKILIDIERGDNRTSIWKNEIKYQMSIWKDEVKCIIKKGD